MKYIGGIVALVVLNSMAQAWAVPLQFRTVVLTGDAAPGTPAGIVFSNLSSVAINDAGQTAFNAFVDGPSVVHVAPSNDAGTWSEGGGTLRNVVRAGDPAVGIAPATTYGLQSVANINSAGQSAFLVETPGPTVQSIYSEGSGALQLIARQGGPAPGTPYTFSLFGQVPVLNDLGQIAFKSFINDPSTSGSDEGLWTNRGGPLTLLARTGVPVPGTATTVKGFGTVLLNDSGRVAFDANITNPGIISSAWTDADGVLKEVMRQGTAAFGLPGVNYNGLGTLQINNANHIAFSAPLIGSGVDATNNRAVWEGPVDAYRLVVRKGAAAPGTAGGTTFGDFNSMVLNDSGGVTIGADLVGGAVTTDNDTGLWREGNSGLEMVAREGDAAPGTLAGVTFGDLSTLGSSFSPYVNAARQVAFQASVRGTGITSANDKGIWATDLSGNLRLIAREGDLFDVNDDPLVQDLRTISLVKLTAGGGNGEDGLHTPFNDSGQLAFALNFVGGTAGVFVASTAVPEPGSCTMVAALGLALAAWRRR